MALIENPSNFGIQKAKGLGFKSNGMHFEKCSYTYLVIFNWTCLSDLDMVLGFEENPGEEVKRSESLSLNHHFFLRKIPSKRPN